MEGSRPTWMRHSVVHRWSYTGTTSQNLSESPRGIQVDSRAHWNYQMIYRTSIYVYVFSLAAKAVKNSRAVWENLLRRIGHLLLCKPGRCAHPHRVRDEPTVWGSTVVNLYLAKPLRSPNHRVHVSIVLWSGSTWVMMTVQFGWHIKLDGVSINSLIRQRVLGDHHSCLFIVGSLYHPPSVLLGSCEEKNNMGHFAPSVSVSWLPWDLAGCFPNLMPSSAWLSFDCLSR